MDFLPLPEAKESAPQDTGKARELTLEEVKSVDHYFHEAGVQPPNSAYATYVGVVEGGKVLGFIVLQAKLHAEPMVVEPGHSDLFLPILKEAERVIITKCGPQYVYVFAPAGRVSQLASSMGMTLEPYNIYSKLVAPEIPSKPVAELPDMKPETEVVQ